MIFALVAAACGLPVTLSPSAEPPATTVMATATATATATASATAAATPTVTPPPAPTEVAPVRIPLSGPLADSQAEISGLGWHGGDLILLPQYPQRMAKNPGGAIFALPGAEIEAFLDGTLPGPLAPRPIALTTGGIEKTIPGFEGFEAIAFSGDRAYLTIEAGQLIAGMKSYLIRGNLSPSGDALALDAAGMVEVPLDVQINNFSNEAIVIDDERVILFYEANGAQANPSAKAHAYTLDLQPAGTLSLPQLEYRLTDATPPDAAGRFWVPNFFFPGDLSTITRHDPLAEQYGKGPTQARASVVERLVELQLPPDGGDAITFAGVPPIQLQLAEGQIPRNWEGIARLGSRGFLLATDEFPETILAFVPNP